MVKLFGLSLGEPKCEQCGMKVGKDAYEWQNKKFCSEGCKDSFRHGKSKGSCCH